MKKAKEKKHIIKKCILALLFASVLYSFLFFNIPYVESNAPSVSLEAATSLEAQNFYAKEGEICSDRVLLLGDMTKGLEMRLSLIDNAVDTIELSMFQFGSGETAKAVISALVNAADRGLEINLIVDVTSNNLSFNSTYLKVLNSYDNVNVYSYGKDNLLSPKTLICSNHDKYMIVDNSLLLLGGRNIEDRFYNIDYEGSQTFDRDILVYKTSDDSVINDVTAYFAKMIASPDTELLSKKTISTTNVNFVEEYENNFILSHSLTVEAIDYYSVTKPVNKISFVNNGTDLGFKNPEVYYAINSLMVNATKDIYMESPYIIMNDAYYETLSSVIENGVKVTAVTNSQASSPNILGYAPYLSDRDELINLGLDIYEYQSTDNIHGKAYVIDDQISIVGSYNFDPRSMYLDTEVMLIIDSESFAETVKTDMDNYKNESLLATPNMTYVSNDNIEELKPSVFKVYIEKPLTYISKIYKHLA